MLNQQIRTIGVLLFAGFAGGLLLTSGPTRWLSRPTAATVAADERPAQEARRGSIDTGHKGGSGGIGQDGGDEGAAGSDTTEQRGQAGTVADRDETENAGDDSQATAAAGPRPRSREHKAEARSVMLSGPQAIAFLVGNTVRSKTTDGVVLDRYLSARGWRGDKQAKQIVAHRWTVRDDRLCVENASTTLCQAVTVRTEAAPAEGRGALVGMVTVAHRKTWPVLRGNVADMPEHLPLLDAGLEQPPEAAPTLATASGRDALKALVRHALVIDRDPEGLRGFYYEPDGRWIETRPLAPGATNGASGLKVAVGEWTFEDGALCVDRPGLDLTRRCFRPEQWGGTTFRLVPTSREGHARTLLVLASLGAR